MKQSVKIIGGKFRGKKLSFPDIDGLRPTPSRIRETLFNWLMHSIQGARCLDAYAGSGALGLEAHSRGAQQVILIEKNAIAYKQLTKLVNEFHDTTIQVIHHEAIKYLQSSPPPFDIIFLDPPFATEDYAFIIGLIETQQSLHPGGLLYIESPSDITLNPAHWLPLKSKQAGQVHYGLYQLIN